MVKKIKLKREEMKKCLKSALFGGLVVGMSLSSAIAGEEACFEIAKSDLNGQNLSTYTESNCNYTTLKVEPLKVASELTNGYEINLNDANGKKITMEYIPTTDIPPGTLIEIKLDNALWGQNGGTLYLLKDEDPEDTTNNNLVSVASTDGSTDNVDTLRFITKAGVTIGAGTRLVISTEPNAITSPKIVLLGSGCPSEQVVKISAINAITDGGTGYSIQGAVTKNPVDLIQEYPQFEIKFVNANPAYAEVDVEKERKKFVENPGSSTDTMVVYDKIAVIDHTQDLSLDVPVTIETGDKLKLSFSSRELTSLPSFMDISLYKGDPFNGGTLINTDGRLDINQNEPYDFELSDLFSNGVASIDLYEALETDGTGVMPYNYSINTRASIDFANPDYLDVCEKSAKTFKIGINGAVLKLPYFNINTSWLQFVKIVNEDSNPADVYADFMANGHEVKNIMIGTVPAKGELYVWGSTIKTKAIENGINPEVNGTFHITFTVTSPKDKVHAVSVQKTPQGQRVVPVLDENKWNQ